jgi:DNA polymerase II small subunit
MNKKKTELIKKLFDKGILVQEDLINNNKIDESFLEKIETEADLLVINEDYAEVINQQSSLVNWYEVDKYKVEAEKERDDELYQNQLQNFKKSKLVIKNSNLEQEISSLESSLDIETVSGNFSSKTLNPNSEFTKEENALTKKFTEQINSSVTILISHQNIPKKYGVNDFAKIFSSRFKFLEKLLQNRRELQGTATISRVLNKQEREKVSMIGIVEEINETKSGNLILTLEDLTGRIKVLISKNKKELFEKGNDIVVDEIIGVFGVSGDKIVFAEKIIWPDIPQNHVLKKGENDDYVVFLSDIHVGSSLFLETEFNKFINWTRGEFGSDLHKEIAKKIKYIFIAGDLVDGIGIYPSQEEELEITDITKQYAKFSELIERIPSHIEIIICPGNHDAVHLAEPQPAFYQTFTPGLFNIPNVKLVTNPALVNIGKTDTFEGFDVLMYHGFSFDYYVANVDSIRMAGGYHRSDLIMKFLLKRRHLAPSFKSTPYYPSHDEDPLLIKSVPDFLITGHIHYSSVANYRGITMISGSCWQAKTTFQEKLGHEPEPARVPIVNLKTREVKILRFG